jgi:light-independent protochlorophyllide reductase B subunit
LALVVDSAPIPSDYFGVLWALSGIRDAVILEHGAAGTTFYNAVTFNAMNRQTTRGVHFTTGMDEDDVVMGREDKIVRALEELDRTYCPRVISLAATAITSVIGLDLEGVRRELQPTVNARLLAFPGGGFAGDYTTGIKSVFRTLVEEVVVPPSEIHPRSVNLIGPTADTFNHPSDYAEIERLLSLLGIDVHAVFTQGTNVASIESMSEAALNIVTRDLGLEAARLLEQRFGTPYHYGLPFGLRASVEFLETIATILDLPLPRRVITEQLRRYGATLPEVTSLWQRIDTFRVVVCCPYDYAVGLTRFVQDEWDLRVEAVVLPVPPDTARATETLRELEVDRIVIAPSEGELRELLAAVAPHVLFGSSRDLRLAPQVPIRIHAAMPTFDHLSLFDGTPFVGFRGSMYLTQTLANELSNHPEVWQL